MNNTRWILCFDFETDGVDPLTCNPVELAAVPIHPTTLEIKKDEAFSAIIKPPGIDKDDYLTEDRIKTVKWHADNMGKTPEEVIEIWKGGMSTKAAWKNFCTYCAKYEVAKKKGQWYPAPIPAGYNIVDYDIPIAMRLAKKFKTDLPFSPVTKLDAEDMLFWWMENLEEPADYKMDTLREFFGIKSQGTAHAAITDVYEEAEIVVRFLKFHRRQASVEKFKGAFSR